MISFKPPLRDAQDQPPIAYCPRCGGEIYENDDVEIMRGELVHESCLTQEELESSHLHSAAFYALSSYLARGEY